ncbi:MAG: MaoC family dehydratase N-terminal domain-containing protein [Ardenticatenaceae bacterium]|nr:MaoC family dehydratase N-terminal domain-containing protein [Ardenticatenaceae bacterium]
MSEESLVSEQAKAMIGQETGPGEPFDVEKGWVRKFAEATLVPDPLYLDEAYASRAGYRGIVAPPGFLLYNIRSGTERDFDIPLPVGRRIKGADEVEFYAPVIVGDTITANTRILDIYERAGKTGRMVFIISETIYTNQNGEVVQKSRATVIKR